MVLLAYSSTTCIFILFIIEKQFINKNLLIITNMAMKIVVIRIPLADFSRLVLMKMRNGIKFNSKEFLLSCEDGQEEHLEELLIQINQKFNRCYCLFIKSS